MNSNTPQSQKTSTLRESVVTRIQEQEVQMIPRLFFVLKLLGLGTLMVLIFIVTIVISNFIFFNLRLNGHEALLSFGGRGILLFFQFFPWQLLLVDLILIAILRYVLKEFSFGYKIPWVPMVLGLLLVSGIGGALIDRATPFNDALLHQADEGHLPGPVGAAFQGQRRPPQEGRGEYRGTVMSVEQSQMVISPGGGGPSLKVTLPSNGPTQNEQFTVGEAVVVLGDLNNGMINAVGVHPLDPNGIPPR